MAPAHHKACDIFVPIIALIVALCLLAVSALQLLRRRFYMAGGYRRCWPSLCRWAPFLDDLRDFNGVARANDELLLSPNYSSNVIEVKGAPMPSFSPTVATVDQRASWPLLLERLRQHESCSLPVPTLALRKNPTKSTSSEVVKPVVVTALPTVAVLARRLGMIWSEFRPERGVLHAEGNRQMLTTRMTPSTSTSIVLRYSVERNDGVTAETCTKNEFYVPVSEADAMGFGILRGCRSLGMPDFCIGTIEEVLDTMDALDPSGRATKTLRDVRRLEPNVTFGFSDLLPLAAPVMRLRGSTIIRLPIPTEYCVGLTCHREGFVIFRHRLGNYKARLLADASGKDMHSEDQQGKVDGRAGAYSPSGSGGAAGEGARQNLNRWHYSSIHSRSQTDWVLAQYDRLRQGWSYWEDEVEANRLMNGRDLAFLEQVHDCWDATTEYFQHLEQRHAGFRYRDLVASHVRHAVHYWADAWARMRNEGTGTEDNGGPREHFGMRDWIAEGAHVYFDYLPTITADMLAKRGSSLIENEKSVCPGEDHPVDKPCGTSRNNEKQKRIDDTEDEVYSNMIHDAWFTMMLRAFCWWRCHYLNPGQDMIKNPSILPSRYWQNESPVYIE